MSWRSLSISHRVCPLTACVTAFSTDLWPFITYRDRKTSAGKTKDSNRRCNWTSSSQSRKAKKLHTLNWEYLQVFFCHVIFRTAGYLKASLSTFNCDGKFSLWVSAEEIFHFHITACLLFRTLVSNLEVSTRQQTSNSRVDFFSSDIENFDLLSSSVRVPSFRMTTQRTYKPKGTTDIFLVSNNTAAGLLMRESEPSDEAVLKQVQLWFSVCFMVLTLDWL